MSIKEWINYEEDWAVSGLLQALVKIDICVPRNVHWIIDIIIRTWEYSWHEEVWRFTLCLSSVPDFQSFTWVTLSLLSFSSVNSSLSLCVTLAGNTVSVYCFCSLVSICVTVGPAHQKSFSFLCPPLNPFRCSFWYIRYSVNFKRRIW